MGTAKLVACDAKPMLCQVSYAGDVSVAGAVALPLGLQW